MEISADFTERVAIQTTRMEWIASPLPGVKQRMLDRIGGEVARATSLVCYGLEVIVHLKPRVATLKAAPPTSRHHRQNAPLHVSRSTKSAEKFDAAVNC